MNKPDIEIKNSKDLMKIINKINSTWRPALAIIIVLSVGYFYLIYPIVYAYYKTKGIDIEVPKIIVDNLTSILLTGGVLAGLRTGEKIFNVTDKH